MVFEHLLSDMKKRGCKITPQRRLILEIISNGGHESAEDIFAEIKKEQPNVAFGTVYRNLNILKDLGLIRELDFRDGRNRFELVEKHHHHLVCLGCGNAIELNICPMKDNIKEVINEHNFKISGHSFKVFGYCMACNN